MRLCEISIEGCDQLADGAVTLDNLASVVSVIGPNSSGKSSLLDTIQCFLDALARGTWSGIEPPRWPIARAWTFKLRASTPFSVGNHPNATRTTFSFVSFRFVRGKSATRLSRVGLGDSELEISEDLRSVSAPQSPTLLTRLSELQNARQPALAEFESSKRKQRTSPSNSTIRTRMVKAKEALTALDQQIAEIKHEIDSVPVVVEVLCTYRPSDGQSHDYRFSTGQIHDWLQQIPVPPVRRLSPGLVVQDPIKHLFADLAQKRAGHAAAEQYARSELTKLTDYLGQQVEVWQESGSHASISGSRPEHFSHGTAVAVNFWAETSEERAIYLWDEPENSLHPTRRHATLARMLSSNKQFILATHASEFAPLREDRLSIIRCQLSNNRSQDTDPYHPTYRIHYLKINTRDQVFDLLTDLGVHPSSSLFTANVVVWVDGPTELVLWSKILGELGRDLVAGLDFTLMSLGGATATYARLDDDFCDDVERAPLPLIDLLSLSRHAAIVLDSDRNSDDPSWDRPEVHKPIVQRFFDAARQANETRKGAVNVLVPRVREAENCLPLPLVRKLIKSMITLRDDENPKLSDLNVNEFDHFHKTIAKHLEDNQITDKLHGKARGRSKWGEGAKVSFMRTAVDDPDFAVDDLRGDMPKLARDLVDWIRRVGPRTSSTA